MIQASRDKDRADIPDDFGNRDYSPYRFFPAEEWARFRADTPLTLTGDEVQRLRSLNDPRGCAVPVVERGPEGRVETASGAARFDALRSLNARGMPCSGR